ncbi:hypothetical protein AMTR_s00072p00048160 [Amborella trichopoda]|uniref:non-specific serine/threonine protein kinase n=1 Tax=Amborella trichopoda TaxID=13333 RepID=W1NUP5_AMBTC|nr:hypothetical protein AMTR_s00072p00048160 [Amborella trichopoda]
MLLFSCLFLFFGSCFGEDTISRGQSLTGNQTITSNGDNFVIGFFTPGNSQNWYIGIWYEKVSNQIVVWVANRDKPLTDNKSELKISEDGNLVLLNKTQLPIWSTNVTLSSTAAISTVAVLLDTGNLVLRGINSSEYIWQSMDHPTDTWLPGGKLGLNKKTNKSQLLTNWRNLVDPFPGPYSLELDPNGSSKLAASELANITRGGDKKRDRVNGVIAGLVAVFVGSLIPFCYRDLQSATKNFSEKLGGGGFGSVFKGTLPDKTIVAVKKLEGLRQGEKQFRMEVSTIGTIQHVNLVRLRGFCSEGARRLLVYDYMPNGSLDLLLFREGSTILDWKTRYEFALGTARGIAYLHEKCRDCIIHCDVKPENILLDGGFCPKVADFGLAKLLGREFSLVLTTMRGTRGYLAPEWISSLAITPKANVYSYGMTLLEMVSGLVELTRACRVACWCIQDDENARPSIGQVLQFLEGVVEVTMPLVPMSLEVLDDNPENVNIFFDYEVLHDKL